MNSEMIEEFVSRAETFGSWERNDLEEIYQEGYEAGKKAALEWQPIETHPKDGTLILVTGRNFDGKCLIVSWDSYDDSWDLYDGTKHMIALGAVEFNYWLPLSVLPPVPEVDHA